MQNSRIQAFDIAKMIAIYAVIITHCAGIIGGMQDLRYFIETFYLSMFFVISGYVTNSSRQNSLPVKIFIWEKFKRLIIPFISIIIISLLINLCISGSCDVKNIFVDDAKGGYWFIYVLFIFNLILCFKRKVIQYFNLNNFWGQIVLLFPWIIIVVLCYFLPANIVSFFSLSSCRRYYLFFIIGYLSKSYNIFYLINQSMISRFILILGYIVLSSIFVCYIKEIDTNFDFAFWIVTNIFGSLFWLSFLVWSENKINYSPLCLKIGQSSLGIYLYHYFLLIFISIISLDINKYLYLFLSSTIVLIITFCFVYFINKNTLLSKYLLGNSKL